MGFFNPWADIKRLNAQIKAADRQIERLQEKLKSAHFRDPKTGRITKRGKLD